ncbi:MAG TPA: aminotransferase [Acidimicrobiales bacterium]|nr:aminotransferase [Acidimicrobiales bacterium]
MKKEAAAADREHLVRGFSRLSDRHLHDPLVIDRGKGVWVWDDKGNPYIEAVAGMWCASLGFGEEELVEAAITQLRRLPYYHTLTDKTVGPAAELAEKLASISPVPNAKVHLTATGSEANDFLVKFIRYRNNAIGDTSRKKVIARINSYHGATLAASSLTGIPDMHKLFDLPLPGILHTNDPHFFRIGRDGETADEFGQRMADELDELIQREGPETIAGFLAEPVTGGGGVIVPPPNYYAAVQEVLTRYEVPFFADEVITGFGRTGNWFGVQTFGLEADTMTLGKGLSSAYQPIAALVISGDIYEGIEKGSNEVGKFAHGATYSGHPVASAVALRTIELMEERDIIGHVQAVMPRFEARLRALADHPLIGDVRVCGLMGAVELVADKSTRERFDPARGVSEKVHRAAQARGVIVRHIAIAESIGFSPPLVIDDAEIDELFDRFALALDDAEAQLSR